MPTRALDDLLDTPLDSTTKGIPLGSSVTLRDIGGRGWNLVRGDLALPVTTLRADALIHNIAAMADYCDKHNALFAPHGKTTMSPQLFQRQLDAGAWAITAATPSQAGVMRTYGVPRVVVANEILDAAALRWAATEMANDDDFELHFLVDHPASVAHADAVLSTVGSHRPMRVFLEVGIDGGRTGVRTAEQATAVAEAVTASQNLQLIGVESYEGLVTGGADAGDLAKIDTHLAHVRDVLTGLEMQGHLDRAEEIFVSSGGSAYFDRVVEQLGDWSDHPRDVRLVLRSGCYVSHDLGNYQRLSPLDGRRAPGEDLTLVNALEAWATVLSTPEPGLAIVGTGKRDVAHDLGLPTPLRAHRLDGSAIDLSGAEIVRVMDQHAFMRVPDGMVAGGDIVVMGLSHPCTAFDKCRFMPVIDADADVVDGIVTFF